MMRVFVAAFLVASATVGAQVGNGIRVGAVNLNIPAPQGYTLVTKEMGPLSRLSKQFVPAASKELATFIPSRSATVALHGHIPHVNRYFRVQITRSNIRTTVSDSEFRQLQKQLKHHIRDVMHNVEKKFPEAFTNSDINVAEKYGLYLAHAKLNVITLPKSRETEQSFAFSILIKINSRRASTAKRPPTITATATLVHVKGKVLFLYVYSMDNNLSWSRFASQEWAKDVILANQ